MAYPIQYTLKNYCKWVKFPEAERSHFRTVRAIAFGVGGWKGAIALLVIWGKNGDRLEKRSYWNENIPGSDQ
jgi:hypothetical protein